MVQDAVYAAYRWLTTASAIFLRLFPFILLGLFAAAALALVWRRLDAQGYEVARERSRAWTSTAGRNLLLAFLALMLCGALVQAGKMVEVRRETLQEASASRKNEPSLSGVSQYAPSVAVIQDKTYTRTLTLPPYFLERLGSEGVEVLSPYLSDPSAENVLKLVDSFKRSGANVVFTRELTRRDEVPIAADSADVQVGFRGAGSTHGRYFTASFKGTYRFKNPNPDPADMRFIFPLPTGGGTLQGFRLVSGGTTITEPDEHGFYAWQGNVQPGQSVTVDASYTVTGSGTFDYLLGSQRRRIGDFKLVADSDSAPRFGKSGIYPSSIDGNRAEWQLEDVLTDQSVSLVFPRADIEAEMLQKTLAILPVVLLLFALGAALLVSARAVGGTLLFGLGLLAIPVLSSYLADTWATVIGALLAMAMGGFALSHVRGRLLAIGLGLLSMAFLTREHGMLVAWILGLLAGLLVLPSLWPRNGRGAAVPE